MRKDGERFVIEVEKEAIASARIGEVSQVAVFGYTSLTAGALHECFRREIPVSWHSYGGWFVGHTVGTGHHNVDVRTNQYRASFDERICLGLARGWVAAKIANCRTLLRRNWRGGTEGWDDGEEEPFDQSPAAAATGEVPDELMVALKNDAGRAQRAGAFDELLGYEGTAAGATSRASPPCFVRAWRRK